MPVSHAEEQLEAKEQLEVNGELLIPVTDAVLDEVTSWLSLPFDDWLAMEARADLERVAADSSAALAAPAGGELAILSDWLAMEVIEFDWLAMAANKFTFNQPLRGEAAANAAETAPSALALAAAKAVHSAVLVALLDVVIETKAVHVAKDKLLIPAVIPLSTASAFAVALATADFTSAFVLGNDIAWDVTKSAAKDITAAMNEFLNPVADSKDASKSEDDHEGKNRAYSSVVALGAIHSGIYAAMSDVVTAASASARPQQQRQHNTHTLAAANNAAFALALADAEFDSALGLASKIASDMASVTHNIISASEDAFLKPAAVSEEEVDSPADESAADESSFDVMDLKAVAECAAVAAASAAVSALTLAAASAVAMDVFKALVLADAAAAAAKDEVLPKPQQQQLPRKRRIGECRNCSSGRSQTLAIAAEFASVVRDAAWKSQALADEASILADYDGEFLILAGGATHDRHLDRVRWRADESAVLAALLGTDVAKSGAAAVEDTSAKSAGSTMASTGSDAVYTVLDDIIIGTAITKDKLLRPAGDIPESSDSATAFAVIPANSEYDLASDLEIAEDVAERVVKTTSGRVASSEVEDTPTKSTASTSSAADSEEVEVESAEVESAGDGSSFDVAVSDAIHATLSDILMGTASRPASALCRDFAMIVVHAGNDLPFARDFAADVFERIANMLDTVEDSLAASDAVYGTLADIFMDPDIYAIGASGPARATSRFRFRFAARFRFVYTRIQATATSPVGAARSLVNDFAMEIAVGVAERLAKIISAANDKFSNPAADTEEEHLSEHDFFVPAADAKEEHVAKDEAPPWHKGEFTKAMPVHARLPELISEKWPCSKLKRRRVV
jgi:hypothetical protein